MLGTNDGNFKGAQDLRGKRGSIRLDTSQAYQTGTIVSPKATRPQGLLTAGIEILISKLVVNFDATGFERKPSSLYIYEQLFLRKT